MDTNEKIIIEFIKSNNHISSKAVLDNSDVSISYATLKRLLKKMVENGLLEIAGKGKGTKYFVSPVYSVIQPIAIDSYFKKEIDEREIRTTFNFNLLTDILANNSIFTKLELNYLIDLHRIYKENVSHLSKGTLNKELERLAIDLSWKSSQIEGNTYSLLETERLLKERETAAGKTKEEAVMLLNHKEAIDFIIGNPDYLNPIIVSKIEDIHRILVKELDIDKNLRKSRVGISGTNYKPLDNEFQIKEAMRMMCELINNKTIVFEKVLLVLVLISYIQPFMDGNKRTARIVGNALLINEGYCPLSFRTVDAIDYKKAMLLFYEQNIISAFKQIFIEQYEFAVNNYF